MHTLRLRTAIVLLAVLAALLASPALVVAQVGTEALAQQSLRPYWYVFVAYSLAWLLLMGWIVSIGRRLRRLEKAGRDNRGP